MRAAVLGASCPDIWSVAIPDVDLLVLPELALTPWLCATGEVDGQAWQTVADAQPLDRLADLPARVIIGTKATVEDGRRFNDAFCWTASSGLEVVHRKTFLPDEEGFWEAAWYERGPVSFEAFDTPVGRIGVSVCTEMWFTQHVYDDVDLVVVPRATPLATTAKWRAGGATHAVCSGAFCLSSNRAETVAGTVMGGAGWIIDPEGEEVALTGDAPVAVAEIDVAAARAAKTTYPRYVNTMDNGTEHSARR